MQRLQDHFQILLAFHDIGAHDEPTPLLDYLLVDLGIISRCIYVIFGFIQLLLQLKLDLGFLHQLLMELGFTSIVGPCDILLLLGLLLLELLQL